MPNIESVTVSDCIRSWDLTTNGRRASLITNFLASEMISSFNLKSLEFKLTYLNIGRLPDVLEIIETKKNLDISAVITVNSEDRNFDNDRFESVEEYFEYARDFIDEKLPIESTEIEITETGTGSTWSLKKTKGNEAEIDEEPDENDCDQCGFDCGQQDNSYHRRNYY